MLVLDELDFFFDDKCFLFEDFFIDKIIFDFDVDLDLIFVFEVVLEEVIEEVSLG